jgi:hypothetical protein
VDWSGSGRLIAATELFKKSVRNKNQQENITKITEMTEMIRTWSILCQPLSNSHHSIALDPAHLLRTKSSHKHTDWPSSACHYHHHLKKYTFYQNNPDFSKRITTQPILIQRRSNSHHSTALDPLHLLTPESRHIHTKPSSLLATITITSKKHFL